MEQMAAECLGAVMVMAAAVVMSLAKAMVWSGLVGLLTC